MGKLIGRVKVNKAKARFGEIAAKFEERFNASGADQLKSVDDVNPEVYEELADIISSSEFERSSFFESLDDTPASFIKLGRETVELLVDTALAEMFIFSSLHSHRIELVESIPKSNLRLVIRENRIELIDTDEQGNTMFSESKSFHISLEGGEFIKTLHALYVEEMP